jgi:hypothetical protein
MDTLILASSDSSFSLDRKQSIELELKLNVTTRSHELKDLGDVLYDFGISRINGCTHKINDDVMEFLKTLMNRKSWQECKGL